MFRKKPPQDNKPSLIQPSQENSKVESEFITLHEDEQDLQILKIQKIQKHEDGYRVQINDQWQDLTKGIVEIGLEFSDLTYNSQWNALLDVSPNGEPTAHYVLRGTAKAWHDVVDLRGSVRSLTQRHNEPERFIISEAAYPETDIFIDRDFTIFNKLRRSSKPSDKSSNFHSPIKMFSSPEEVDEYITSNIDYSWKLENREPRPGPRFPEVMLAHRSFFKKYDAPDGFTPAVSLPEQIHKRLVSDIGSFQDKVRLNIGVYLEVYGLNLRHFTPTCETVADIIFIPSEAHLAGRLRNVVLSWK